MLLTEAPGTPAPPPLGFGAPPPDGLASQLQQIAASPDRQYLQDNAAALNNPPSPDTGFLGAPISSLPGYVPPDSGRALQPYQLEDRNAWIDNLIAPAPAAPAPAPVVPAPPAPAVPPPAPSVPVSAPSSGMDMTATAPSGDIPPAFGQASETSSGGVSALTEAIDQGTPDPRVRLAMRMGALLEGGSLQGDWQPGDSGTSFGPFQIHLPAHPGMTAETASDPAQAAQYMLPSYTDAVSRVPASLWQADPHQAAAMAVYFAERPATMYSAGAVQAAAMRLGSGGGFPTLGGSMLSGLPAFRNMPAPVTGTPSTIAFNNPDTVPPMDLSPQEAQQQWAQGMMSTPEGQAQMTQDPLTAFISGMSVSDKTKGQLYSAMPEISRKLGESPQAALDYIKEIAYGGAAPGQLGLEYLNQGLGWLSQQGTSALAHYPVLGPLGTISQSLGGPGGPTIGQEAAKVPGGTTALGLVGGSLPYLAAGTVAPESVAGPLFGAISASQSAPIIDAWQQGQIDNKTALEQLGMALGPVLAPVALSYGLPAVEAIAQGARGAGQSVQDFLASESGQQLLAKAQSERGGGPPEMVPGQPLEGKTPPMETPPQTPGGDVPLTEGAQPVSAPVGSATTDELAQFHQRLIDAGATPQEAAQAVSGRAGTAKAGLATQAERVALHQQLIEAGATPQEAAQMAPGVRAAMGGDGSARPPAGALPDTQGNPLPAPDVPERLSSPAVIARYIQRQVGLETDPAPVRRAQLDAARQGAAETLQARRDGERLTALQDPALQGGGPVLSAGASEGARAMVEKMTPLQKLRASYSWPGDWVTNPAQDAYNALKGKLLQQAEGRNSSVDLKVGTQTDDPRYAPRQTLAKGDTFYGPGTDRGFMMERSTGNYYDYLAQGHEEIPNDALVVQHLLEASASARVPARILQNMRGVEVAGRPALVYDTERPGYSPVDGMGERNPQNGKQWLAQNGKVSEAMSNAFSKGLPREARGLILPAKIMRSFEFVGGMFHLGFENVGLAGLHLGTALHSIPEQFMSLLREGNYARDNEPNIDLFLRAGSKAYANQGGQALSEMALGRGAPEQTSVLGGVPGVGKVFEWNRKVLFDRLVPMLQHENDMASFRNWMMKHQADMPADFAEKMTTPEGRQVLLDGNPRLRGALEGIAARGNHVAGFTENTLGRTEVQASQALFNTPTILKSMIANTADIFRPPGDLRGTMARTWWRNVTAAGSTLAVGGTMLAHGGQSPYTDPTSPQFVLNPNGPNFMDVVLPDGTRLGFLPPPIKAPLKVLTAGPAAAATAGFHGAGPLQIAEAGGGAEGNVLGQSLYNRLSGPLRAAPLPAAGNANYFGPHSWQDVPAALAGGSTPIFLSPFAQQPPHSLGEVGNRALRSVGQFAGISTYPPSPGNALRIAEDAAARRAGYPDYQGALTKGTSATMAQITQDPAVMRARATQRAQATGPWKSFYSAIDTANQSLAPASQQLEAGGSGQTWRAAYHDYETRVHQAATDLLGQQAAQDPLLQKYETVLRPFQDASGTPSQAGWDALDAWKASLPQADQQHLDNLLQGTSPVSPTVREYRATTRSLQSTGWFVAEKQIVSQLPGAQITDAQGNTPDTIGQWENRIVEEELQKYNNLTPLQSQQARAELLRRLDQAPGVRRAREGLDAARWGIAVRQPHAFAGSVVKFGFASPTGKLGRALTLLAGH